MNTGSDTQTANRERIVFLDYLRGLACMLVVFGHIFLMGINDPGTVAVWLPFLNGPIFGPDSPGVNPFNSVTTWLVLEAGISLGALGVAVFFLVSGFVIQAALDREPASKFLVKRAFRLFPNSLLICAVVGVITAVVCNFYGVQTPHTLGSVIATGFAVPSFTHQFSSLPVIWTLAVELVFYLVMAAATAAFGWLRIGHIFSISLFTGIASLLLIRDGGVDFFPPETRGAAISLGYCLFYIGFLLVGSALFRTQSMAAAERIALVAIVAAPFCGTYFAFLTIGKLAATGTAWQSLVLGFLIFAAAMVTQLKSQHLKPLRFFGDVSYSLYLIHVPLGWMMLFGLSLLGIDQNLAAVATIVFCLLLSALLYWMVELPSQRFGRQIAAMIKV